MDVLGAYGLMLLGASLGVCSIVMWGATIVTARRTRDVIKVFISAPFAAMAGASLFVVGFIWAGYPDDDFALLDFETIMKGLTVLIAGGVCLGIVARRKGYRS